MVAQPPPRHPTSPVNHLGPICVPGSSPHTMPNDVRPPGSMSVHALLLAHQGGWDEILLVIVPILIFAALLGIADRRATRARDERDRADPPDPE